MLVPMTDGKKGFWLPRPKIRKDWANRIKDERDCGSRD